MKCGCGLGREIESCGWAQASRVGDGAGPVSTGLLGGGVGVQLDGDAGVQKMRLSTAGGGRYRGSENGKCPRCPILDMPCFEGVMQPKGHSW